MTDWVRLYHDMPTDPKWRSIAKKSGQRISDVIAVWSFVLCNASANTNERGRTHNFVREDVAAALDMEIAQIDAIIEAMENKTVKDGKLLGWEKRNPIRENSSAQRCREWREHKRTQMNTRTHANVPESDTEKDISSLRSDIAPRRKKPMTSLPENFPDEVSKQWALRVWTETGRDDLCHVIHDEAEKFRDHHTANPKGSADWPASWRTWAKNAMKFNRKAGANDKTTAHDRFLTGGLLALESRQRQRESQP